MSDAKTAAAERRLVLIRLLLLAVCTSMCPALVQRPFAHPTLTYALVVFGWAYSLYLFAAMPSRRHAVMRTSAFITITDGAYTMVSIYATGGFGSPFFIVMYLSVIGIAFRYSALESFVAACVHVASYLGLVGALGQIDGNGVDVFARCAFLPVAATLGNAMARELFQQTHTRLEAERAAREMAQRAERDARTAVGVRDEFLSIASHELRTPLAVLQLHCDRLLAMTKRGAPITSDDLQKSARQVVRLTQLVDNLLDVSRITQGGLHLELADVDLTRIVRDVAARFAEAAQRAGSTIVVDAAAPVVGRWDALRVDQIVTNLLSNAVKYGEGRPIDVEVRSDGEAATLVVRDRGLGIDPEEQARIFDRFERTTAARSIAGLGLGLWIARRIVEHFGGSIAVESTPRSGSTFTVRLPLRRVSRQDEEA